jgi:hypothetical protein
LNCSDEAGAVSVLEKSMVIGILYDVGKESAFFNP